MAQSFAVGGCPSTSLFCPTTLVRKPVRYVCMHVCKAKFHYLRMMWNQFDIGRISTSKFFSAIVTIVLFIYFKLYSILCFNTPLFSLPYIYINTHIHTHTRSKYCTRTGCVVARFDHQCLWLNTTIGHNNHRTFIVFLVSHLLLCTATLIMLLK